MGLWVRNVSAGHELTHRISGLQWSSIRPGGDERCQFVFHAPWRSDNPEIAKGAVIHVGDGLDVLWAGRIEELDRGGERNEQIAVTAYGLGKRLKDNQMQEIYIDRDLGRWGGMSTGRRIHLVQTLSRRVEDVQIGADSVAGQGPGILIDVLTSGADDNMEAWYFGGGLDIGGFGYDFVGHAEDSNWVSQPFLAKDDIGDDAGEFQLGTDHDGDDASDQLLVADGDGYKYAVARDRYAGAFAGANILHGYTNIRIYGRNDLTPSSTPVDGFTASALIEDIIGRVSGITLRRLDETTFEITQCEFIVPVTHEEAIDRVDDFDQHQRTWGTWGPDNVLDRSLDGQFDYVALEPGTQHWIAYRRDCEDIGLATELEGLYDQVDVHYTDEVGRQQIVTRTRASAELSAAGLSPRTARLDGGKMTQAAAQTLGDAFLSLLGGFAPARGSLTISTPVRHHRRGPLPPHYMRADGSNLRIPDILPSSTLFELDSDPDRRTTFPIHRVNVDASGETPRVSVEVDQTNDTLSALQARLALAAEHPTARPNAAVLR